MESTDLRNILSGPETNTEDQEETPKIKNSDKHILNKSFPQEGDINVNDFLELEEEIEVEKSMYDREWTKLEKGMKLNRLQIFVQEEKEKNDLDEKESEDLKTLLFKMCNDGQFNKANIVEYENEKIMSIKILEYDEDSKKYRGKKVKKKVRATPKSKSNLDRLLKKNKS